MRPAGTTEMLDIFEGTQQIQQLIVARRLLGKTSARTVVVLGAAAILSLTIHDRQA